MIIQEECLKEIHKLRHEVDILKTQNLELHERIDLGPPVVDLRHGAGDEEAVGAAGYDNPTDGKHARHHRRHESHSARKIRHLIKK